MPLTRWTLSFSTVENFEISVPFVPTNDNEADFFTKAFDGKKFFSLRAKVMNERVTHGDTPAPR